MIQTIILSSTTIEVSTVVEPAEIINKTKLLINDIWEIWYDFSSLISNELFLIDNDKSEYKLIFKDSETAQKIYKSLIPFERAAQSKFKNETDHN